MTATTWDPANKAATITLSNGNLTATTASSSWGLVLSTTSKSTGKFMLEILWSSYAGVGDEPSGIGLGLSTTTLANFTGATAASFGYFPTQGHTYINGSLFSTNTTTASGAWNINDVLGIAFDFGNQKFWVRKNGNGWFDATTATQDPATNTGGVSWSTVSAGAKFAANGYKNNLGAGTGVANFSTTPAFALPSGFDMWDPLPAASNPARLSPMAIT